MKKHLSLIVCMIFLAICSVEVGSNLGTLLEQDADGVLYIESGGGGASAFQEDLENFDFSADQEFSLGD